VVVRGEVAPGTVVVGVPARPVGKKPASPALKVVKELSRRPKAKAGGKR
jgi:acetyltransferase-like isoleucine patch superfamily enzyme